MTSQPTIYEQFKAILEGHIPTEEDIKRAYDLMAPAPTPPPSTASAEHDAADTFTAPKKRAMLAVEVKDNFMEWMDKHRDDIRYANKGYIQRVKSKYEQESGNTLTDWQFRRLLDVFRSTHNCPLEYVPNKYYKPVRKYCLSRYSTKYGAPGGTSTGGTVQSTSTKYGSIGTSAEHGAPWGTSTGGTVQSTNT